MSLEESDSFFIVLHLKDGEYTGHSVTSDKTDLDGAPAASTAEEKENVTPTGDATTFEEILPPRF